MRRLGGDKCSCNGTEGFTQRHGLHKRRRQDKFENHFKYLTKGKLIERLNNSWNYTFRNNVSFSKTSGVFLEIFNPLGINVKELVSKIKETKEYTSQYSVESVCCKFVVNPRHHCDKPRDFNENFLILMVKSRYENHIQRQTIRRTWGNETYLKELQLRIVFVLGQPSNGVDDRVAKEISRYGDILQLTIDDTYFNNTFKTIATFHWLSKYCSLTTKYVMLVDDDYYVSPEGLVNMLLELPKKQTSQLYMGTAYESAKPHRIKKDSFYVSDSEYPYELYPPFTPAGSTVLSMDFVQDVQIAMHLVLPFVFDDVYIGIIAYFLKISPKTVRGVFISKNIMRRRVKLSPVIACHGFTHEQLLTAWQYHRKYKNPVPT